jgi:hypothetical protein
MRVKCDYRQASRETYNRWKSSHPNSTITFLEYQNIIYTFNYNFRDYILESGNKAKMPWGFGDFAIAKNKRKKLRKTKEGKDVINLAIDWKKTRAAGKHIYHMNFHTEGYSFKWKWFIKTARFYQAEIWTFKPSRVTSRLLKHYITERHLQNKYKEWK